MRRLTAACCLVVCFLSAGITSGCNTGGGSPPPPSVSVAPATATVQAGNSQAFSATVTNDSSNRGVTWAVSGAGCTGAACGSLTNAAATSVTYTAPANVPTPNTVTLTATSVADTTKSAQATITIAPIPGGVSVTPATASVAVNTSQQFAAAVTPAGANQAVTWSVSGTGCSGGACGTVDSTGKYTAPGSVPAPPQVTVKAISVGNLAVSGTATVTITLPPIQVSVSPTSASVQVNATQLFTATVANDPSNSGVVWTVSGSGCTGTNCGTINPTTSASGQTVTYTAPASVPTPAQVTLTAASVADNTKSASATITITAPPPIAVSVLPTTATVVVNGTQQFMATVANDPSNRGVVWTVSGSGCTGANCGTVNPTTSASGQQVTYTAPATVPNPAEVTLTAASLADSTKSASATVTITLTAGVNDGLLNGSYAFLFTGWDANGMMAVGGTFFADGTGGIPRGVVDIARKGVRDTNEFIFGRYTIGADRRGTLSVDALNLSLTFTFRLSIDSNGREAHFIEFDTTGFRGSGVIKKQTPPFALSSLSGDYAFGIAGNTDSGSRFGSVGTFSTNGAGPITSGSLDVSLTNVSTGAIPISSGTITAPDSGGRGTVVINAGVPGTAGTFNFDYYMISSSELFLLNTDAASLDAPRFAGTVFKQNKPGGGFSNVSLNGTSVFSFTGFDINHNQSNTGVGQITANGAGTITSAFLDQNADGVIISGSDTGTYTISSNGRGVLSLTQVHQQVLYMVDTNKTFFLEGTPTDRGKDVTLGLAEPQTGGPFSPASLTGDFIFGTVDPVTTLVADISRLVQVDSTKSPPFSGTVDISDPTPSLTPDQPFTATYATPLGSNGRAVITVTPTGGTPVTLVLWVVSPSKFVAIDGTNVAGAATNTNTAVFVFEK